VAGAPRPFARCHRVASFPPVIGPAPSRPASVVW
jgi:hypothetical protein